MTIKNIKKVASSRLSGEKFFSSPSCSVIKLPKHSIKKFNCYSLALGLTFPTSRSVSYAPGFTEGYMFDSWQELLENTIIDCNNLNIPARKLGFLESSYITESEYLIRIFYSDPTPFFPAGEFHFVRQDPNTGTWYHKPGFPNQIEIAQTSDLCFSTKFKPEVNVKYYPVCYMALKDF